MLYLQEQINDVIREYGLLMTVTMICDFNYLLDDNKKHQAIEEYVTSIALDDCEELLDLAPERKEVVFALRSRVKQALEPLRKNQRGEFEKQIKKVRDVFFEDVLPKLKADLLSNIAKEVSEINIPGYEIKVNG